MSQPSDDLTAFAALKGWPVTTGGTDNGRLFCRGREAGLNWHVWTGPPILGPLLTMVVEVKSGFSFEIRPGAKIRPGSLDHRYEEDEQGRKHLVRITEISPAVESWISTLEPDAFTRLALEDGEEISVHPETVAITFRARGLGRALYRAKTLLDVAALLPKKKAHRMPKQLRPIAPLIRSWSISDDAKREKRLAATSRPLLEELLSAWRAHLDLINATIEARPTSDLSTRLMAFSQAAMEADLQLRGTTVRRRTRPQGLLASREAAVYQLVLRHTVEVGHGWGKEASPLRGFYVLNRVIPNVEDPSSLRQTLDDEEIGVPLTRDLMQSLEKSLQDVSEIEFVPKFLELVDLKSTQPVQVRGSRGFVAFGPIREADGSVVVGVYFYAGGRWSRSNRYELVERGGIWGITKFQNLVVS